MSEIVKYYVYKYVNKETKIITYVGKTENLEERIKKHKYDSWYVENTFDIYYIECDSKAEMDILETYFISFYNSCEEQNIAKNWGSVNQDILNIENYVWVLYKSQRETIEDNLLLKRRHIKSLKKEVADLSSCIIDIQDKIFRLQYTKQLKEGMLNDFRNLREYSDCVFIPRVKFTIDDLMLLYDEKILNDHFIFYSSLMDYAGNVIQKIKIEINKDSFIGLLWDKKSKQYNEYKKDSNSFPILNFSLGSYYCCDKDYYRIIKSLIFKKSLIVKENKVYSFNDIIDNQGFGFGKFVAKNKRLALHRNCASISFINGKLSTVYVYEPEYERISVDEEINLNDIPDYIIDKLHNIDFILESDSWDLEYKIDKLLEEFNFDLSNFEKSRNKNNVDVTEFGE